MIGEQVIRVIQRESGMPEVEPETPLHALGLDSLDFLDLLLKLREETGKDFPNDILSRAETVADLAAALEASA